MDMAELEGMTAEDMRRRVEHKVIMVIYKVFADSSLVWSSGRNMKSWYCVLVNQSHARTS
jgi:hypothetical protein